MQRRTAYLDLNTYLSTTGDMSILSSLGEKVGKCLELKCGGKGYNSSYYLPKLYIKDIDLENSMVTTQEVIYTPVSIRKEGDGYMDMSEYTTFDVKLSNKEKKYKLSVNDRYIKIGTRTATKGTGYDWRDLPSGQKEVRTYYRYID